MDIVNRIFHPRYTLPFTTFGALVGGTLLLKDYYGGDKCPSKARVDGKTVIITGANSGIGKETALELAKRGGKIILACRDIKKAEKAREEIVAASGNTDVKVLQLDLASLSSIRQFADKITSDEEGVDVLVNNAGLMRCPKWKTEDGFEMQFGVNHLGHFYLTNLLLDKLKSSAPSRIINVSSVAHQVGKINFEDINSDQRYNSAEAYANSKLAKVLFTRELSKRLEGTGVTANVLHPGVVKTNIGRHTGMHQSGFSMAILGPIFWLFVRSPQQGAQTSVYCAVDPELEKVSGQYFRDCKKSECDASGKDDEAAAKLWDVSCQLTGLSSEETKEKSAKTQDVVKEAER
ncbi:retinol dehydrogenase 13 [Strongylocentrotus purpuratus]|uniref:Retinol dehydrogenase 13 n=1 Tax=Strongylocentrotus purpuratus TaxID=7668 RepID=A0A7M7PN56_STRPU|nr:retinol dehydrogenase 13 [Strongylocentrotus purpuratus]